MSLFSVHCFIFHLSLAPWAVASNSTLWVAVVSWTLPLTVVIHVIIFTFSRYCHVHCCAWIFIVSWVRQHFFLFCLWVCLHSSSVSLILNVTVALQCFSFSLYLPLKISFLSMLPQHCYIKTTLKNTPVFHALSRLLKMYPVHLESLNELIWVAALSVHLLFKLICIITIFLTL